jgi:hypothetical protein
MRVYMQAWPNSRDKKKPKIGILWKIAENGLNLVENIHR